MLFNEVVLQRKNEFLDAVLARPDFVEAVIRRHIHARFKAVNLNRVWEPGGGSTLFRIETSSDFFLLKVKHREIWIESQLEGEGGFSTKSSLSNEHDFFRLLEQDRVPWVPRVRFFDNADSFEFLAVEWLKPFHQAVSQLNAIQLLDSWQQLTAIVRELFCRGIVHTDIHEHNLCLRGDELVLVDFEEARFLRQKATFEQSLDVVGYNRKSNVGCFPTVEGAVPGLTCLNRLKTVFKQLIRQRLGDLLGKCNFDHNCPFNLDIHQQPDSRVYQSLDLQDLKITGQRPLKDRRVNICTLLLKQAARHAETVSHLDVGSNLGAFCFQISSLKFVERSIGIDASQNYVDAGRVLAFLYDRDVLFRRIICGEDSIAENFGQVDVITMFSVYHHIADKMRFLADLRNSDVRWLIAEFATESRYYPERGSLEAEINYIQETLQFTYRYVVAFSGDYCRPIVLFSHDPIDRLTVFRSKWIARNYHKRLISYLREPVKTARKLVTKAFQAQQTSKRSNTEYIPAASYRFALRWLRRNSADAGGVRVTNRRDITYPEVAGYCVPTLLHCGEHELAMQYARWLISIQNTDGSWSDAEGKAPYTFDTGQVLKGLWAIFSRLPEAENAIQRGCDWMLAQIGSDGRIMTPDKAMWELGGGQVIPDKIHLYALSPLREAAKVFQDPRYDEGVHKALSYYVVQPDLVRFDSLSHFHAYVLEALIDLGCPELAKHGMEEVERLQRRNGAVPAYRDVDWVCSTGLAQYAVVWYKLGHRERADKALKYLCRLQNRSGGLYGSYGRGANYFPNEEISWAVKYFLDAYHWHVRRSFDTQVASFPSAIEKTDGRFESVLRGIGHINGLRVLDAGCGKGRFSRALREQYPTAELWGVDLSEAMLRSVPASVRTRQGSLANLPFENSYFDRLFSVEALEHSINPQVAVREMCRVLKPGGRIIIIDKNIKRQGAIAIEEWELWFEEDEVSNWLKPYCGEVRSEYISWGEKSAPDGLFVAWSGVRR